ncbi:MAG TPA: sulfatase-like hydrolase/transferase [Thermoanaerobaculia bacterium]|nr:sulfatase-like hydrolase/transferase [Thermoanaerobaculia bacterium]
MRAFNVRNSCQDRASTSAGGDPSIDRRRRAALRLRFGFSAAVLLAVAAGWGVTARAFDAKSAREEAPPASRRETRNPDRKTRNLVLLTLDTTRADHLGKWGNRFAHTPNLDALADRGVRFAHCDTAAPITLPSHSTILTGLFPPRHGVRDNGTFKLRGEVATLAERLSAAGYDTAAVVSAIVLARRHGLDQGFRSYDDDLESGYATGTEVEERQADKTTAAAVAKLGQLKAPFFLWVHYYDPHEEYRPPTRFADSIKGPNRLYDGEIAFMDEQIGLLLQKLPPDTDIVVVGDHGEMLGEHGEKTHGVLLYQGARRVPLIMAGPSFSPKGAPGGKGLVRDCLVRTVDVTPTFLALAGLPTAGLDGKSLWPLASKEICDRTSYSETFLPFFAYKWYPLRSLANDRFFFLQAPKPSLYDLRAKDGENRDLAAAQPKALAQWGEKLRSQVKQMGESLEGVFRANAEVSDEERKKLASLGYVTGGGGGAVVRDLPDPRSMTEIAQYLHRAAEDVQQGKCSEALPKLLDIIRRDTHNFPALNLAGLCLKQAGRIDEAIGAFTRALKENDLSTIPIANLAGCYLAQGKKKEAEREYRRALVLDETQPESAANLARLLRESGRRPEAIQVLKAAKEAGSLAPQVFFELGLAQAEGNDLNAALSNFREAARRDPANPAPIENAAHAAYQLGRTREAAQFYEQILRLAPSRGDLWKTLGAIYLYELNEKQNADRCFRRALTLEQNPEEREKLEQALQEIGG